MKVYPRGKDREYRPCIELNDGTVITELEVVMALIKALVKKNVIKPADIKTEL